MNKEFFTKYILYENKRTTSTFLVMDCGANDNSELTTKLKPNTYVPDGYKKSGEFYAISPILRPIPMGTKLYCAKRSKKEDIGTAEFHLIYDIFDIQGDCTYFIAYNQKVPDSKALYVHTVSNGKEFLSFDMKGPPGSTFSNNSPVYVFDSDAINKKFGCILGRCMPWGKDVDIAYNAGVKAIPMSFIDCLNSCKAKNKHNPYDFFGGVNRDKKQYEQKDKNGFTRQCSLTFVIMGFVILILIVVYIKLKGRSN